MSRTFVGLLAAIAVAMTGAMHAEMPQTAARAAAPKQTAAAPPAAGTAVQESAQSPEKTAPSAAKTAPSAAAAPPVGQPSPSTGEPFPEKKPSGNATKYTLRYKFKPGQTLRWEVVHRARVETAIAGVSQTVDTYSRSIKVWRVTAVASDGTATFENSVEQVEMRQKSSGRMERRYDSQTDKNPPPEFQGVAQSIGVPLWSITLDPLGKIVKREILKAKPGTETQGQITLPLPQDPVAVGQTWTLAYESELAGNDGTVRRVKIQQRFTLESVEENVATIRVSSQVLTPVREPAVEALLVQREASGRVRFDIDAGKVLEEQMEIDKEVVGFAGKASTMHYRTRLTEKYLGPSEAAAPRTEATASRPTTHGGPPPAKR